MILSPKTSLCGTSQLRDIYGYDLVYKLRIHVYPKAWAYDGLQVSQNTQLGP